MWKIYPAVEAIRGLRPSLGHVVGGGAEASIAKLHLSTNRHIFVHLRLLVGPLHFSITAKVQVCIKEQSVCPSNCLA